MSDAHQDELADLAASGENQRRLLSQVCETDPQLQTGAFRCERCGQACHEDEATFGPLADGEIPEWCEGCFLNDSGDWVAHWLLPEEREGLRVIATTMCGIDSADVPNVWLVVDLLRLHQRILNLPDCLGKALYAASEWVTCLHRQESPRVTDAHWWNAAANPETGAA